jgi:hypothetical protein
MGPPKIRRPRYVLRGLARNPAAPGQILIRLSSERSLARALAFEHPGPPIEVLDYLLAEGDPDLVACLGIGCTLPQEVRWRMAGYPDARVRKRAMRKGAPPELVESLVDDPEPEVRAEVAADRRLSLRSRVTLSRDANADVRAAVAQFWRDPPEDIQRTLLTDSDPTVRAKAVSVWHRPPPPDLIPALLIDPATRADTVRYGPIGPDLIEHPDHWVRHAVAGHPDLDESTAIALSRDQEPSVIYALIFNPGTPEVLRADLVRRVTTEVRPGFLSGYYFGNAWKDRASTGWLWDAPLSVRLTYVDSPYFFFRRAIANTELPPDAVGRLLRDPDPGVQRNVARCNKVPPEELARIVAEFGEDPSVAPNLTDLPHFPQSTYEHFATSADPEVRELCAQASHLPDALVAKLATDRVDDVRCAAAAHANLPLDLLTRLLADRNDEVAEAAGASPSLPLPWMQSLALQVHTAF